MQKNLAGLVVVGVRASDLADPPNEFDGAPFGFWITEEGAELPGDLNLDGRVDGLDLTYLGLAFGAVRGEPGYALGADIDFDNRVDGDDLAILAGNFGEGR